jgi:hypothetical protein
VGLLIALWGAALLLSALVLLAGYRRRGQGPVEPAPRPVSRASVGALEGQGAAATGNGWMFSGGA